MPEHVTLDAPLAPPAPSAPDWLRSKFLDPNEQVVWWRGPTLRPWRAWFEQHQDRLFGAAWAAFFLVPIPARFAGAGACFFSACLVVGLLMTLALIAGAGDKFRWQILTDRRLLVVTGRKKTEEFDLVLLRQLLASAGIQPASEQVIDLGKVGAIGGASQSVTDLASILAMAKVAQQIQEAGKTSGS